VNTSGVLSRVYGGMLAGTRGRVGAARDETVNLLGVGLVAWTEERTVAHVIDRVTGDDAEDRGGWIVTVNTDILRQLVTDPEVREVVEQATLGVADGMPLVWASRLGGTPVPQRVAGASLLHTLCAAARDAGCAVYLLGGEPGVADAAGRRLADRYPALRVTGWSPPFGLEATAAGIEQIRARIRAAAPDLVFCGFGFPKQERLIAGLTADFPDTWFVGCGGSFNFAAGRISRAPRWMQHTGLEWVHRLICEPRRMFRRYVIKDIPFAIRLLASAAWAHRVAGSNRHAAPDGTDLSRRPRPAEPVELPKIA
jgi:N-acetylglucosaminyldiphosphoundecaprenol N-acetyl-beta-D-mannosaminyltransferase